VGGRGKREVTEVWSYAGAAGAVAEGACAHPAVGTVGLDPDAQQGACLPEGCNTACTV